MIPGLRLGAPGIYRTPERADRAFQPVRLDVAGFAGIAPRGPIDEPVALNGWGDYRRRFGGFEGRGLLPYAVSAFFDQGGEKAWVVRVGPQPDVAEAALAARSRHRLADPHLETIGPADFLTRDEGSWGDRLRLRLEFDVAARFRVNRQMDAALVLPDSVRLPTGSLLRARGPYLPPGGAFRWAVEVGEVDVGPRRRRTAVTLDTPLPTAAESELDVAVITATLLVDDEDPTFDRGERFNELGLHPDHPRFLPRVVEEDSLLVTPTGAWRDAPILPPDVLLTQVPSRLEHPGRDREAAITGASFFDDPDDPTEALEERRHRGVDALAGIAEIGLLAVPDVMWSFVAPDALMETAERPCRSMFQPCREAPPAQAYRRRPPVDGVVDGRLPDEFDEIVARQRRLVAVAERHRRFVVLLDVPRGLPIEAIERWRASFDSGFAAAYHPWLGVARPDDSRDGAVFVPPSGFAAGIIARRERRHGVFWGPANELARGAVIASDRVGGAAHDRLHSQAINVFLAERDGFRLAAARTLSRDRDYRQLSVRRLMTMLRLAIEREAQWVVFEPNTASLRTSLRFSLTSFLRELYQSGAFAGASESEAFFVRCDDELNPPPSLDLGRLVAEVGVAPAEPLEYIVLRIALDRDGIARVEERRA